MNYRTYWWKCTKEALSELSFYLVVIGSLAGMLCLAGLLIFLGIKSVEFLIPIFGEVISIIILIGTMFSGLSIILLFFHYRHYKKYVKDGVKE